MTCRPRTLDTYVVVLGAVALLFIGPVRSALAAFPLLVYLSALYLFMVPGVVLVRSFLDEHLSGAVMAPASFALSVGVFGLMGVPFLMLHGSLELYLWIAGAVVATSLVGAILKIFRRKPSAENGVPLVRFSFSWLWVPFLLLGTALAYMSRQRVQGATGDMWVYLAWVREFLNTDKLTLHEPYFGNQIGTSRAQINGWLLEQAALSRVSGIDPVELVLRYLEPTLVVMSLLAFYALAKTLFKSETAALLAGSLYALLILVSLVPFLSSFGGEFISRVAEDKFVAWYFFFPVALVFAYLFLESSKWRYLIIFAFLCWTVVAIHPVGLAIIGLCTAGLGLFHLAVNLRDKGAWIRTLSLGGALLSIVLAPLLYLLITGDSLVAMLKSADINYGDPDVLANMVFVRKGQFENRLLELGDNRYMVDPARLRDPAIVVAFLVGLPFVLFRLKRSLAAQLLAGMLLVPTVVCFVPPIATFFGNHIVLPGQMWRLAWPIPLAAMLIVGWMVWEVVGHAQNRLESSGVSRRLAQLLPLVLLCALIVAAAPKTADEAKAVNRSSSRSCVEPIYRWIQDHIRERSVILAPDSENTCIPAYSAKANVVSLRGMPVLINRAALERRAPGQIEVPQGVVDVNSYFSRSTPKEKVRILRRHDVNYVMVPADSHLDDRLKGMSGYTDMDVPGERYSLYAVDRSKLRREVRRRLLKHSRKVS